MADPEDGRMTGAHVDEGEVHAWLDGQLSAAESARLESHIAACEPCAARVAEARGFVAALSRILSGLDGVPLRVVPRAWSRARVWQLRAAAAVVVVALGAAAVLSDAGGRLGQLRREPVAHHPDTAVPPAMGPALATAPLATPAAPPPAAAVSFPPSRSRTPPRRRQKGSKPCDRLRLGRQTHRPPRSRTRAVRRVVR